MRTMPPKSIAIVDDDRDMRALLRAHLERAGYQVLEAPNGLRLLSILRVDRPDLILLDVMMSWIDGFELCRSLKANPEYRPIAVCFVTALTAPEQMRRGLACGGAAYLTKPIDFPTLLAKVSELTAAPSVGEEVVTSSFGGVRKT